MADEPAGPIGAGSEPPGTGESATRATAPGVPAPRIAHKPTADIPLHLGRYTIVRVLGEGGMGTVYEAQQENPKRAVALKLTRESLDMWKRLFPGDHPLVAAGLNNLAHLLEPRGDLAGAEPLYREAIEMRGRVLGEEHPDTHISLDNLVFPLIKQGRFADAAPLVQSAPRATRTASALRTMKPAMR